MLFFLISCFSFIILSSSKMSEWRLLSPWFWGQLSSFIVSWFKSSKLSVSSFQLQVPLVVPLKKVTSASPKPQNVEGEEMINLLELPDLTLECILEKLSPGGLCSMGGVCRSLRESCRSDHFWGKHMEQKWGRVIGEASHREWQWHVGCRRKPRLLERTNHKGLFRSLYQALPISWISSRNGMKNAEQSSCLPLDAIKDCYLSLENGKFWFPAQVYNRENGHVGFMLSCYDAKLCYDSKTDTFQARYSPQGRLTTEENIGWDRLRAAPVDTPAHVLHASECLNDLKPGDHIEIQWRRNKDFPYGWWYGVVGHLESCDGNEHHCHCHWSDTIVLEFNQYTPGSRWRQTMVNRKDHREEGDEADGFYGGIRKLCREDEISTWKRLWPKQVLE